MGRKKIYGGKKSPEYRSWQAMKRRCDYPGMPNYERYGGRGIRVCDRWKSFATFYEDMGPRPDGMTLDRIDSDGDYTPENCRWATPKTQQANRKVARFLTLNGETRTIGDWADHLGMYRRTITLRLERGWSVERALSPRTVPEAPASG